VAHDWHDFGEHVVSVLTDDRLRLHLETQARDFARQRFAPSAVFSPLTDALSMHHIS
jgi:hypothetical protein